MTTTALAQETERLARLAARALRKRGWMCVTAESCTGGWIAQVLTSLSGSSDWFERGFVVYSNAAKTQVLGVPQRVLDSEGAVSEGAARAIALGALAHSEAQVAVSVTGIAGPTGATPDKPVGTVCFGWATGVRAVVTGTQRFSGDRTEIRWASVRFAIEGLVQHVERA